MGVGVDKTGLRYSTCNVLLGEVEAAAALMELPEQGLALLPANADMTAAEVGLRGRKGGEVALRKALTPLSRKFDYIIVDCPPALSMLTVNALSACDGVLITMQCEYYALEGLAALLDTIDKVRAVINPELRIEGILRTMYDPRNNLSGQVSAQLTEHYPELVYRTIIPRNVRLAEAPSHGLPVLRYDPSSSGAEAYLALAGEVLRRVEKRAA
jgi:chromosome partitioning protein